MQAEKAVYTKKIICVLAAVCILYLYGAYGIFSAGKSVDYAKAAAAQSESKLRIAKSRGTIYDCNLQPMTNRELGTLAVAMPVPEALKELVNYREIDIEGALKGGMPIIYYADNKSPSDFIDFFSIPKRYGDDGLCAEIIGYVDGSGNGVTGAEAAFNDILNKVQGELNLSYSADALGRILVGEERHYENSLAQSAAGVAITIDREIQKQAEKAAEKMKKGAVLVVSVPDCKIKACVSSPGYSQNNLEEALNQEDSPFINRAFTGFAPGSVFKLVVAAAALENGIDSKTEYNCTGLISVDGQSMSCYGGKAHGSVNLHTALQKSCNSYFIRLGQRIPPQDMCATALNLGFGTSTRLYGDFMGDSGNVPNTQQLGAKGELANFSIGQGQLTVTPLQVAAMVNCIASGGIYTEPSIFEGEINEEKEIIPQQNTGPAGSGSVSALEAPVALRLKSYMESTAKFGTAREGAQEGLLTGAKTGTAQTGIMENGEELLNYWYAGFTGSEKNAEYVIVAMEEGANPSENPTAQVFKELSQFLKDYSADNSEK